MSSGASAASAAAALLELTSHLKHHTLLFNCSVPALRDPSHSKREVCISEAMLIIEQIYIKVYVMKGALGFEKKKSSQTNLNLKKRKSHLAE